MSEGDIIGLIVVFVALAFFGFCVDAMDKKR